MLYYDFKDQKLKIKVFQECYINSNYFAYDSEPQKVFCYDTISFACSFRPQSCHVYIMVFPNSKPKVLPAETKSIPIKEEVTERVINQASKFIFDYYERLS